MNKFEELVYRLENSMGIDYDLLSQAANKLRQQQTMIDEYIKATDYWMKLCQEANANYTPQIKELSDEEIKKCVIAWVKQIYGNEYVTPSDRHIINGTKLIRLAEKRIFKNDSL